MFNFNQTARRGGGIPAAADPSPQFVSQLSSAHTFERWGGGSASIRPPPADPHHPTPRNFFGIEQPSSWGFTLRVASAGRYGGAYGRVASPHRVLTSRETPSHLHLPSHLDRHSAMGSTRPNTAREAGSRRLVTPFSSRRPTVPTHGRCGPRQPTNSKPGRQATSPTPADEARQIRG